MYDQKCSEERHFGQLFDSLYLHGLGSFELVLELMIGLFSIFKVMEPQ
jgi:hypothetical protein